MSTSLSIFCNIIKSHYNPFLDKSTQAVVKNIDKPDLVNYTLENRRISTWKTLSYLKIN